jgi:two-component system response regulator HydG
VFDLGASTDANLDELLRLMLQQAVQETGADAGGALLLFDLSSGQAAVELLSIQSEPLHSRAELLKNCKDMCLQATARGRSGAEERGLLDGDRKLFGDSRTVLRAPVFQRDHVLGLIQMESVRARGFTTGHSQRFERLARDAGIVISRTLLREYAAARGFDIGLVGSSPKLLQMEQHLKVAASDSASPVLIVGERGSGKELAAHAIHYFSRRRAGPFLPVNSGAFSDSLLSDELFGHERHSFTGADTSRAGIFKAAEGGTLFFDEIGDMGLTVQASLLRVLDQGELRRIGSDKPLKVDVRVIGATNRDLRRMVAEGSFRADVYDRLNVFRVEVPTLRERKEDIPRLASYFLKRFCVTNGRHHKIDNNDQCLSCMNMMGAACARQDFYDALNEYSFPGNVRELRNLITRIAAEILDEDLGAEHVRLGLCEVAGGRPLETPEDVQLEAVLRNHIARVLRLAGNNKSQAARLLGLPLTTLINKMKKLGL